MLGRPRPTSRSTPPVWPGRPFRHSVVAGCCSIATFSDHMRDSAATLPRIACHVAGDESYDERQSSGGPVTVPPGAADVRAGTGNAQAGQAGAGIAGRITRWHHRLAGHRLRAGSHRAQRPAFLPRPGSEPRSRTARTRGADQQLPAGHGPARAHQAAQAGRGRFHGQADAPARTASRRHRERSHRRDAGRAAASRSGPQILPATAGPGDQ